MTEADGPGARPIRVPDPGEYRRPEFPPSAAAYDVPNSTEDDRFRKAHEPMPGATATMIDTAPPVAPQLQPQPIRAFSGPLQAPPKGSVLGRLLRTTDAKQIGLMYGVTALVFFMIGGLMALLMRAELARPGLQFLSEEQYNQLFTEHGTIMLLLFATPIVFAFANYVVPLQIGAPDVAFPRLNAFAYWLYLFGGLMVVSAFLTPGGAPDFGWTAYTPLSEAQHTPGVGANMWIIGLVISGVGTILGAV